MISLSNPAPNASTRKLANDAQPTTAELLGDSWPAEKAFGQPLRDIQSANPEPASITPTKQDDGALETHVPGKILTSGLFEDIRTAPIQIWEGRVLNVDRELKVMQVMLSAKMGVVPDHTGEISLEWVSAQDMDLLCSGAIFYWTLYKETKRGSIKNSQELRFRRRPSWSESQIARVRSDAAELAKRIKKPTQSDAAPNE